MCRSYSWETGARSTAEELAQSSLSGGSPLDPNSHLCYFLGMSTPAFLKNTDFQLISEFAQPDAKKRLSLGEALGSATAFIDVCINNAMIQRKEMDSSDWAMHPRNFSCEFRIPSMEPTMSSINSSTSFGQLLANSRLASDQTPSSGFSCGA